MRDVYYIMILMHFYFQNVSIKVFGFGTHLNCLKVIKMSTNNICFYKEVDKSMGCNLKAKYVQ